MNNSLYLLYKNTRDMRYLIIADGFPPAFTKWFEPADHFNKELNMIVIDLIDNIYTKDGDNWEDVEQDKL